MSNHKLEKFLGFPRKYLETPVGRAAPAPARNPRRRPHERAVARRAVELSESNLRADANRRDPESVSVAWLNQTLAEIEAQPVRGYLVSGQPATEPTALAALALAAHGRLPPAARAGHWLARGQAADGSLGINRGEASPHWPTGLAILAWSTLDRKNLALQHQPRFQPEIQRGCQFLLSVAGETIAQAPEMGHDTSLVGWPWVEGTHSWIVPTAFNLLALRSAGHEQHPRAREARKLLLNRLLPGGGCNYGNTTVLGQTLRAHLEPTGIALFALGDGHAPTEQLTTSLNYLQSSLGARTTSSSLGWALLGLAAHGCWPTDADAWLEQAQLRTRRRGTSLWHLALLAWCMAHASTTPGSLQPETAESGST